MASGLGELFIELGVHGDSKKLEEFTGKVQQLARNYDVTIKKQAKTNTGIVGMVKNFRRAILPITAAVYALDRLTNSLIQNNQAWLNLQNQTDLSISNLQGYAGVAGLLDKSLGMHGAAGSIAALNEKLFELRLTGEGAKGFQMAGINPMGQDAFGVIEQVRERIKNLDNTTATYLLKQIGLDARLLPMLRMQKEEFEALRATEQRLQLTDDERNEILQNQIKLGIAQQQMQLAMQRLTLAFMPIWTKLSEIIGDFAEGISNLTRGFKTLEPQTKQMIAWIIGLLGAFKGLDLILKNRIFLRFAKIGKMFKGVNLSIASMARNVPILGHAFKGLAVTVARALLPLVSLYLLLEDFMVWKMGGKSVIGDFLQWQNDKKEAKQQYDTHNIKVGDIKVKNKNNPRAIEAAKQLEKIKKLEQTEEKGLFKNTAGDIERVKANMLTSPEYYKKFGTSQTTNNTTNAPVINQHNYINTTESGKEAKKGLRESIASFGRPTQ